MTERDKPFRERRGDHCPEHFEKCAQYLVVESQVKSLTEIVSKLQGEVKNMVPVEVFKEEINAGLKEGRKRLPIWIFILFISVIGANGLWDSYKEDSAIELITGYMKKIDSNFAIMIHNDREFSWNQRRVMQKIDLEYETIDDLELP